MNIFTLAALFIILILIVAAAIMWMMVSLSRVVTTNEAVIEANDKIQQINQPETDARTRDSRPTLLMTHS